MQIDNNFHDLISYVLVCGLGYYIWLAWKGRKDSWRIEHFFLGGRNIGARLTEHLYWGSSFSFANGIFYFAVLGFYNGLSPLWLQVPWVLAIGFMIWRLPVIIKETENNTLHGFLGSFFGSRFRKIASWITIFGFLGAFAFEINVSTEIIVSSLGIPHSNTYVFTVLISLLVAAYCGIGGFKGTAQTDKLQNQFGGLAILLLLFLVVRVGLGEVNSDKLSYDSMISSFLDLDAMPIVTIVGILCFASTMNIVDFSNWQAISANSGDQSNIKSLRWAMFKSSMWMLVLPAFSGTFLGYVLKDSSLQKDSEIFPYLLSQIAVGDNYLSGLVIAFVLLGLASIALSTADSYLMATSQTHSWDLKHSVLIDKTNSPDDLTDDEHRSVTSSSRRILFQIALISVLIFAGLRWLLEEKDGSVFVLQFVIYGAITSLAPSTIYSLWLAKRNFRATSWNSKMTLVSVIFGFLSGVSVFIYSVLKPEENAEDFNAYAISSIVTLSVSIVVWLIGLPWKYEREPRKKQSL